MIRRNELRQIVPLADTTIYEIEERGEFPLRVALTPRCVVWDLVEVEAWVARFDSGSGTGDGVTNAYDGFGRLTATTTTVGGLGGTVSSTYDADGNRTQVMPPDGAHFDSTFDAANRFTIRRCDIRRIADAGSPADRCLRHPRPADDDQPGQLNPVRARFKRESGRALRPRTRGPAPKARLE